MTGTLRLLLVGGGHAHLEILRRLTVAPPPGVDVLLVSSSDRHHYSGMVPGYLRGTYREEEISFPLPALARAAGARFLQAEAVGVEPERRVVHLEGAQESRYDLVSFNLGSRSLRCAAPRSCKPPSIRRG